MNNLARIDIAEIYNKQRKDEYIQFLKELGDGIRFEEDTWRCSNIFNAINNLQKLLYML
jgi:hypothetical protein